METPNGIRYAERVGICDARHCVSAGAYEYFGAGPDDELVWPTIRDKRAQALSERGQVVRISQLRGCASLGEAWQVAEVEFVAVKRGRKILRRDPNSLYSFQSC